MPLYMDIHNLPEGTTPEDVAKAHEQGYGNRSENMASNITKYWVNENGSKVFCLAHAPNAEAAECVHREAHGMMAEKIIEVQPESQKYSSVVTETNRGGSSYFSLGRNRRARSGNPNCPVHRRCEFNNVDAIAG